MLEYKVIRSKDENNFVPRWEVKICANTNIFAKEISGDYVDIINKNVEENLIGFNDRNLSANGICSNFTVYTEAPCRLKSLEEMIQRITQRLNRVIRYQGEFVKIDRQYNGKEKVYTNNELINELSQVGYTHTLSNQETKYDIKIPPLTLNDKQMSELTKAIHSADKIKLVDQN